MDFDTPYELLLAWKDDEPNPSAATFREVAHDVVQEILSGAARPGPNLKSRSRGH